MNFLYNLFFFLIDFKSPGVIQGELQLFSSLALMTFKGKQAYRDLHQEMRPSLCLKRFR